jgi:thiol:disulfide interchange protein DsbD
MFGGRLGELDAFVPEPAAGAQTSGGAPSAALDWMKDDYRGALDRARRENKLVFVSFTGYACTNCHWMKANMLSQPEIASVLGGFVLVELYTDGTDAASDANAKLELTRFQTSAVPFYAIVDADENVIATSAGVTRDPQAYLAFLRKGSAPSRAQGAPREGAEAPAPVGQASRPAERAERAAGGAEAKAPSAEIPTLKSLDGASLGAPFLRGKVVVINFWATWCAPCIQELPGFNKLHQELGPKGVAIIGVSMDDDVAKTVPAFLKKHPIDYMIAVGKDEFNQEYALDSLPVTLVFGKDGKLQKRFDGFTEEKALRDAIAQAM